MFTVAPFITGQFINSFINVVLLEAHSKWGLVMAAWNKGIRVEQKKHLSLEVFGYD